MAQPALMFLVENASSNVFFDGITSSESGERRLAFLRFKQRKVNLFLLFKHHLYRHADGHGLGIDIDDLCAESQARLFIVF